MRLILASLLLFLLYVQTCYSQEKFYLKAQGSTLQGKFMDSLSLLFSQDNSHPWNLNFEASNSYSSLQDLTNSQQTNIAVVDNFPANDGGASLSNNLCLPTSISSIVIIVNIPDFPSETVKLNLELLYLIYSGVITTWNDPKLVLLNPWLSTVSAYINRFYRTDLSGTSSAFCQLLSFFNTNLAYGYNFSSNFNINTRPSFVAESNSQLVRYVSVTSYSIAYVSAASISSYSASIRIATINDKSWTQSKQGIMQWSEQTSFDTSKNVLVSLYQYLSTEFYPLQTVSYFCVTKQQNDNNNGIGVLRLFFYLYAQSEAVHLYDTVSYFAIPSTIRNAQVSLIMSQLQCSNQNPCINYYNERFSRYQITIILVVISIVLASLIGICCFVCCVGVIIPIYAYRVRRRNLAAGVTQAGNMKEPLLTLNKDSMMDSPAYENIIQQHQIVGDDDLVLDELIGSGSFAQVYKGRWLGVVVAIKKMKISDFEAPSQTNSSDNSTSLEDFIKETKLISTLKHPCCLQFLGTSVKAPFVYLITEYCGRGSVQSIIRNKSIKLSLRKSIGMMLDAARGMLYLHSHNPPIIHRDFKSANLLVNENWSVKVADFGMSTTLKKGKEQTICGTPETAAPEVLARSSYTEKADVYSFGIVLWEVLTREILYPGLNFYELSVRVVNEGLRPSLTDYDFPTPLRNLMKQTWSAEPEERPSFVEIVKSLEEFHTQLVQQQKQPQ